MTASKNQPIDTPDVVEQNTQYSIHQFCEICKIDPDVVTKLIREGVIQPHESSTETWVFTQRTVTRFKRAYRLQRDLDLNLAGVALSVDLLEEIDQLREEIAALKNKLNLQP